MSKKTLAAVLAAGALALGAAAPASAHQGDFGTQWNKTRASVCQPYCTLAYWYYTGDHSRTFVWQSSGGCRAYVSIGHDNYIWNEGSGCG